MKRRITFTETPGSKHIDVRGTLKSIPVSGDHRGWAEWWGRQALLSIRHIEDSVVKGFEPLDERQAVRAARMAWSHACRVTGYIYWDERVRPSLGTDRPRKDGREAAKFLAENCR